jgi:chromosome partitioning protein
MRFIAITSYKGGVGKTTSAIHLAGALVAAGERVLVADGDANRSALRWAERAQRDGRPLPFPVVPERAAARAIQEHHPSLVIIDTAARPSDEDLREIAEGAQLILVPTTCDQLSLEGAASTLQAIGALGLSTPPQLAVLLTRVPPAPRRDGDEAAEAMTSVGVRVIGRVPELVVFQRASEQATLAGHVRHENASRAAAAYAQAAKSLNV